MIVALTAHSFYRGVYAALASFLMFSMIQFRDGPFIRPHPALWRAVLGINLLYELALVFLLFQDLDSARTMMTLLDPALGVPLPEKSYAENCAVTANNVWVSHLCRFFDEYIAHLVRDFGSSFTFVNP